MKMDGMNRSTGYHLIRARSNAESQVKRDLGPSLPSISFNSPCPPLQICTLSLPPIHRR